MVADGNATKSQYFICRWTFCWGVRRLSQINYRANWGRNPRTDGEPVKELGLGRGFQRDFLRNVLKFRTWNRAIWCNVEAKFYRFYTLAFYLSYLFIFCSTRSGAIALSPPYIGQLLLGLSPSYATLVSKSKYAKFVQRAENFLQSKQSQRR